MLIPIERKAREPVAAQIAAYLRRAIEAGRLEPGAKLEPIRVLAKQLGLNRETVATAYRELEQLGLTEAAVGRGTFVLGPSASTLSGVGAARSDERSFEPVFSRACETARASAVARIDYSAPPGAIHFERLIPDAGLYPHEAFRKALNVALAKGGPALYDYGDPRGHEGLRRALVERMARSGIEADSDGVVITAGATQGFAIAARIFCDAGDAVAVESPTYPWAFATLAALGLRAAPIPLAPDGLDLDRLDAVLAQRNVRLIYTMPSFHNPTGTSSDLAHRRRLLEIAARHGVPILEDDFEKDLRVRGRGAPPLRALDRHGIVSYLGTFSKTLFPAARVGWLFAPPAIAAAAVFAKRTMDLTTSPLLQAGLAVFLREGSYDRHLRRVVKQLEARLEAAEGALARHLPDGSSFSRSEGGFLVWVTLPDAIDSSALLDDAKRAGVVYAPGELFYPDGRRSSCLRLSVANTSVAEIERGVAVLGEVARAALARGRRRAAEVVHV
ncbi:MAG: PLP-dependent aminotransferase family protein [Deltaproteobacteria bacterium]|nr:PLP-dependent aminotransferase family protein [Deltaproteobacteria bacterium]